MPKARRSKKSAKMSNAQSRAVHASQSTGGASGSRTSVASGVAQRNAMASATPATTNRRFTSPRVAGPQSLILPSMVALGSWGMAFSFAYFYNDPNHLLFAGLAVLMALLWTYSVYIRIRKLRAMRQKSV